MDPNYPMSFQNRIKEIYLGCISWTCWDTQLGDQVSCKPYLRMILLLALSTKSNLATDSL